MVQAKSATLASILALGISSCGGPSKNAPPPQVPTDTTTLTSAPSPFTVPTDSDALRDPVEPMFQRPRLDPLSTSDTPVFGDTAATMSATAVPTTTGVAPGRRMTLPTSILSDGQIVAILDSENTNRREQAREALRRARSARVRMLAQQILNDHAAAQTKLRDVETKAALAPVDGSDSSQLKSRDAMVLQDLQSANERDFDKVYLDAQVEQSNRLLDLITTTLMPQSQNPDLKRALQDARAAEARHLATAQNIDLPVIK